MEHSTNYLVEIHIKNSIVRGQNAANKQLNHSCLLALMEDQNDCINSSLQLKSYMECKLQEIQNGNQTRNNIILQKISSR